MPLWFRNVYLDHNATTPVAAPVRSALRAALRATPGNPSSLHTHGRVARGLVERSRESVAALLGCPPERVVFTSGGTEGNNAVIKGVWTSAGRGHIVTSKIEHESVLDACRQMEGAGASVTYLPAGPDGLVRAEDVKAALRPDTVLISIMHANNETGAIQPVADIARIARAAGIAFHTDAVQTCGKLRTFVDEIGCEFLTLSAHKINGPKGCGALYWRGNTNWTPLLSGGYQEQRLRGGTEGVPQIAGLGVAARLAAARMDGEFVRLRGLRDEFLGGLRTIVPDVRVNESPPDRQLPGTLNLSFPGREGIRILAGLDCYGVSVSIGSACTADRIEPSHVLMAMGRSAADALSAIRISMGAATSRRDLAYALDVLKIVLRSDPPGLSYLDPQHLTESRIESPETFLVDLRFPYERLLAPSIRGAREWSHLYFERYFRRIPWDKEVILMCGTGIFSLSAGYRLAARGHPKVRVVYGGYAAWKALHPGLDAEAKRRAP
jgi:cysteine desulfurase